MGSKEPTTAAQSGVPPVALQGASNLSAEGKGGSDASGRGIDARKENRRWWLKLTLQPLLFVAGFALLFAGLGLLQQFGVLTDGQVKRDEQTGDAGTTRRYICPMMCTPPQSEPGRCPVCAMELVPMDTSNTHVDEQAVQISPAARRVANIETAAVREVAAQQRSIHSIGQIRYDESALRTIAAYVGGRLEKLYADYTGVEVTKGDDLALIYSPELYSAQVELLLARKYHNEGRSSRLMRVTESSGELYQSARQRLIEMGVTESQVKALETANQADSRLRLSAPMNGTVIEKLAVAGTYVKEGQPIYRLADLSTLWLTLELFPADATAIRYGQQVQAEVQSLPGQSITGRVVFVDPDVDPKTRTVGVRIVLPNQEGRLRVGDLAKATINVPIGAVEHRLVYDPELSGKWISPRHPQIVSEAPGKCPLCGIDLVPAEEFGYSEGPTADSSALIVPRSAVLMAGATSVLYVETEPGRFEIRRVTLGPELGDNVVVSKGVLEGELVATRGNFLVDSQMQLAGNPSLIDPDKAIAKPKGDIPARPIEEWASLPAEDIKLAQQQGLCPVSESALGSMGTPIKVEVNGRPVFICCEGCRDLLLKQPERYLKRLDQIVVPIGDPASDTDGLPPISAPVPAQEDSDAILSSHLGRDSTDRIPLEEDE
ncbi:MAG: efflux RND transporter periplasmic adaptor subunit [Pirellulaceae bacterium]|nr:efflux RND transporter periplasmic adaptor subunit [Planctomycetales bacterium]